MNALEIAKFLLDASAKKTGRKGTTQDINDVIAKTIAAEFPETSKDLLSEALRIVNDVLSKDELYKLRKIDPVNITGLDIGAPENGEPIYERVNPAALYVDPAYQRQIGARGLRQIRRIVEAWDWNKFKPPIVAFAEHEGVTVLKVLDGQHTAIAAASHPEIDFIPIMIVEAAATSQQAASFVGQNTQRLQVTALQLHQSALVAHDLDAMTIDLVCQQAGVTILRHPGAGGATKAGQTVAINAIAALIDKRGNAKSREILEVMAKAAFAPILKDQIKAVELLLTGEEYFTVLKPDDLIAAITGTWSVDLDAAKQMSLAQKWPLWKALAIVWFRKSKKSRPTSVKAMRAA